MPPTPTARRRQHSKNLEFERYVAHNGKILISIASGEDKPILPYVVRFSNTIGVLIRDTFPVYILKWTDVTPYNSWFVKHQMLSIWKEFRGQNHHYFKKFADSEQSHSIDIVELFRETHARGGQFVLQAVVDAHRVLNHSLDPRYARSFLVVDWATQKVLEVNDELKTRLEVVEEESHRKHEESTCLIAAQARHMEEQMRYMQEQAQ
ncbi:CACTA en-spm transposon protein [Cucumis melo var. makuwa]|uniref:CACTA en-spm transposon protein n=1 Tax=Cucumis melo var. makuwa TaxID=1194695 RepID=A0A5D3CZP6_CUCMM|nr:CACTA en-spm transposon protein [Cucumis melo var. makuwa]